MRWNCPHCGISLAVSDEKLGTGWSFSRCYKCGGFALVRRSDVNLIKVDKAPTGEKVLLPEATEEPMLSQEAMRKHAKPAIRPQTRTRQLHASVETRGIQVPGISSAASATHLPEPLPEISSSGPKTWRSKLAPVGLGAAVVMVIGSGIFLYQQAQELLSKTKSAAIAEQKQTVTQAPIVAQATTPTTANVVQAPPLVANAKNEIVVDQVQNSAMAPARPNTQSAISKLQSPMLVEIKTKTASLRSGPGLEFAVIGVASAQQKYPVADWNEHWFKVIIKSPAGQNGARSAAQNTAWVRNDLVQLVTAADSKN